MRGVAVKTISCLVMARIIKRYSNRKLYDTEHSRYVTLDELGVMIRSGDDIQVIDNNSKDDLTALTLTQIIFEQEKKGRFLPLSTLRNIIQSSGQSIQQLASHAGEKVLSVLRRDHEKIESATPAESENHRFLREFLDRSQHFFDDWQKRVDERIRHATESLSPLGGVEKELRALRERIEELENRVLRQAQDNRP